MGDEKSCHLSVSPMTPSAAEHVSTWCYEYPYDFYNADNRDASIRELLGGNYFAVFDRERDLVGFFCHGNSAQVPSATEHSLYDGDALDIGLGMRPDLTGRGFGREFIQFCLHHMGAVCNLNTFRLTVASFNQRAVRLYKNCGFQPQGLFHSPSGIEFTVMTYRVSKDICPRERGLIE